MSTCCLSTYYKQQAQSSTDTRKWGRRTQVIGLHIQTRQPYQTARNLPLSLMERPWLTSDQREKTSMQGAHGPQ